MKNTVDYTDHLRVWRKSQIRNNSLDYRGDLGILRTPQIMMNSYIGYITKKNRKYQTV